MSEALADWVIRHMRAGQRGFVIPHRDPEMPPLCFVLPKVEIEAFDDPPTELRDSMCRDQGDEDGQ